LPLSNIYNKLGEAFFMIVYITENLINGKKYIGKDSKNNSNYLGSGRMLLEAIKIYGRENFKKTIIEYCNNNKDLSIRESFWIKEYNALESDDFYNLVDFSAGWNLEKLGKEKYNYVINKISISGKGKLKPELSHNKSRKSKLSKANKGKSKPKGFGEMVSKIKLSQNLIMSQETKDKISKAKLNHPCFKTKSFKEKNYKPIIQIDKKGNIIKEFKSIEEAANSNIKFKRSNISCCLTGFSKSAYGYNWKYKNL
jgi:group I intron endonuclease